jgi:hypothetical protein
MTALNLSDGSTIRAKLTADGLLVAADPDSPPRLIPWDDIADLPASYVVATADGMHSRHATRRAANDRAADLSAAGVPARVYGVPVGLM